METGKTAQAAAVTPHRMASIPLDQLSDRGDDVRRTPAPASAERALVASIRAHGLLENLVVIRTDDWIGAPENAVYRVVGGRRRYAALCKLAEEGAIGRRERIACSVVDGADPDEVALAENAVRVQMHDADRIDAFAGLVRAGRGVVEVANRFGVDPIEVERFLRLESVHPEIRAAHRADRLSTRVLAAYAISTDRQRQLRVWKRIGGGDAGSEDHTPKRVRTLLSEGGMPGSDRLVRFVGVDSYRAAGGAVCEDLFTAIDEPEALIIAEPDKLRQMAADKLQAAAVELTREWEWADAQLQQGWNLGFAHGTVKPDVAGTPTEDEAGERDRLEHELDNVERMVARAGRANGGAGPHGLEDLEAEQARLKGEIRRIDEALEERATWSARVRAVTGCVVTVDDDGALKVIGGLVRPQDVERVDRTLNPAPQEEAPGAAPVDAEDRRLSDAVARAAGAPGGTERESGVGAETASAAAEDAARPREAPGATAAPGDEERRPVVITPPVEHEWREQHPGEAVEDPATAAEPAEEQLGYTSAAVAEVREARRRAVAEALAGDHKMAAAVATFHLAELAAGAAGRSDSAGSQRLPLATGLAPGAATAAADRPAGGALDGEWRDRATQAERFEALLALDPAARRSILAEAVAALTTARAAFEPDRSGALEAAIARLRPRWRRAWSPGETFFGQLTRERLLQIGEHLAGTEWARSHRNDRKDDVAAAVAGLFEGGAAETADWVPAGFEPEAPAAEPAAEGEAAMPAFLDAAGE